MRLYRCSECGAFSTRTLWRFGGRLWCERCLARESARVLWGREVAGAPDSAAAAPGSSLTYAPRA